MRLSALAVPALAGALALSGCTSTGAAGGAASGSAPGPAITSAPAQTTPAPASSSAGAPTATTTAVSASDTLDQHRLGPIQIGMSAQTMLANGYIVEAADQTCTKYDTAPALAAQGVALGLDEKDVLAEITLLENRFATRDGARVGMRVAEVQKLYGDAVVTQTREGDGEPFQVLSVRDGDSDRELLFSIDVEHQPIDGADTITSIHARAYSSQVRGGC